MEKIRWARVFLPYLPPKKKEEGLVIQWSSCPSKHLGMENELQTCIYALVLNFYFLSIPKGYKSSGL